MRIATYLKKVNATVNANSAENLKKIDVLTANTREITDTVDDKVPIQRTIQIETAAVIVNKCIITPITLHKYLIKVVQM